ncbi:hypothetical protein SNOG_03587 [Parastagonospora nodorum SN15]|uniref:Uncharacterized protein n=1 Tax=Phaeosphaeria nodorum (strain SN15 / ATCC MYA-4574 / FGSC 10173) TaxID=321614 RepID=Q0UXC7_PHANO|nr:hypothetical protein SNOG_03587 [Parastagonospora nodorum SN15]EAT88792.1 hypothetical protein SNOG_03587 [Parastagonospora nodorum SN15]
MSWLLALLFNLSHSEQDGPASSSAELVLW